MKPDFTGGFRRPTLSKGSLIGAAVAITAVLFALASPATAADQGGASDKLGSVIFPTSCTPAAQQQFERALNRNKR